MGEDGNFTAQGIQSADDELFTSYAALCNKCSEKSPFIHRQRYS